MISLDLEREITVGSSYCSVIFYGEPVNYIIGTRDSGEIEIIDFESGTIIGEKKYHKGFCKLLKWNDTEFLSYGDDTQILRHSVKTIVSKNHKFASFPGVDREITREADYGSMYHTLCKLDEDRFILVEEKNNFGGLSLFELDEVKYLGEKIAKDETVDVGFNVPCVISKKHKNVKFLNISGENVSVWRIDGIVLDLRNVLEEEDRKERIEFMVNESELYFFKQENGKNAFFNVILKNKKLTGFPKVILL